MKDTSLIYSYINKHKHIFIASVLLVILEVLFNIPTPKVMALIIDEAIPSGNVNSIFHLGIIMLILCVLGCISGLLATVLSGMLASKVGHDLRTDMFSKMISMGLEESDKINKDSVFTRISNDSNTLMDLVAEVIHVLIKPCVLFVMGMAMTFYINFYFGIILLISLPLQLLIMVYMYKHTSVIFGVIQGKIDDIIKHLRQAISGARIIRNYSKEKEEIERFKVVNYFVKHKSYSVWKLSAFLNMIVMLLMNLVIVLILYVGGLQANSNSMQVGHILASITYSQQVMMSLMSMGLLFRYLSKSKIAVKRIAEILKVNTTAYSSHTDFAENINEISFENVSFAKDGKEIIKGVSFDLNRGETLGIVGRTASGKSLLIDLLIGLYEPTGGKILINGKNLDSYHPHTVRRHIAVSGQDNDLFSGTVKENIMWGEEGDYVTAAEIADAYDFINSSPKAFDLMLNDKGRNLSGGQKQRVKLARAICSDRDVLVIDDALSEIDTISEKKILDGLFDKYEERIMIITSQRVSSVINCDRIIVMEKGQIVEIGSHEELVKGCSTYKELYYSQNGGVDDEKH